MSKWYLRDNSGNYLTNAAGQCLYEQINLPTEYQEVDYIQATGTQYIDTEYVLKSNNVKMELNTAWTGTTAGTFATYVGFMPSGTTPRFGLHNYSSKIMHGMNATISVEKAVDKDIHFYVLVGNGSAQNLTIDGVTYAGSTSYSMSSNTLSMTLFARRTSASAVGNYMAAKIFRFKLWVDGKVVRNMIPCYRVSDNVIGMYDVIGKTFHINKGTGTFTKGENVYELPSGYQKVEYISTNTTTGQYIDTGVIPSYVNGTKVQIDFAPSTLGNRYALLATYNNGDGQMSIEIATNNKFRMYWNGGGLDLHSTNTVTTSRNTAYLEYKDSKYYMNVNGTVVSGSYAATTVPNYSMYMFLDRAKRTTTFTKPLKIYGCKIWVGNEMKANFVPCYRKSDNVIGMFDIVTNTFFPNKGTGSFTKGANVSN